MPVVFDEVTARIDDEADDEPMGAQADADTGAEATLTLHRFAQLQRDLQRRLGRLFAD